MLQERGGGAFLNLQKSNMNIHIIGVDSDMFFTAIENKETFKQLAQVNSNVTYGEVNSLHGHDAFLIEFKQLEKLLKGVFNKGEILKKTTVLKFGGKSLANGEGLDKVLSIIVAKVKEKEKIAIVLSARGNATDQLEYILKKVAKREDYKEDFNAF